MSKQEIWSLARGLTTAVVLATLGSPLAGQERDERACRCMDASGRELDNCVCIQSPDVRIPQMSLLMPPRARIGVSLREDEQGARVQEVLEDSPAEAAGLREGDVIIGVDGRTLSEALSNPRQERGLDSDQVAVGRLMALARTWEPGEPVELELLRDGERLRVEVEPEEAPSLGLSVLGRDGVPLGRGGPRVWTFEGLDGHSLEMLGDSLEALHFRLDSLPDLRGFIRGNRLGRADPCLSAGAGWLVFGSDCVDGVRLVDLNPELGSYFGTEAGALVADVAEGSTLGLRPGDVIVAVGGRDVTDAEDARRILASYRTDEAVDLSILRQQEPMELSGTRR